jgi:hypothetical protein
MKRAGRLLFLSAFLASAALAARAQAPTAELKPPAAVVKFSWSKERANWERDPFGGPLENFDEMRARARNERQVDDAKRGGGGIATDHAARRARADAANAEAVRREAKPPRYGFLYKATFRNDAPKAIRVIDWDYVFTDAMTGEELGRRQFTSEEEIGPGRKKELSFFVPSPPALRISAHSLDRGERDGLVERVEVVRVLYEDGSTWLQPDPARPPN